MKRWDLIGDWDHYMAEMADGDYVEYADAHAAITQLADALNDARAACALLRFRPENFNHDAWDMLANKMNRAMDKAKEWE